MHVSDFLFDSWLSWYIILVWCKHLASRHWQAQLAVLSWEIDTSMYSMNSTEVLISEAVWPKLLLKWALFENARQIRRYFRINKFRMLTNLPVIGVVGPYAAWGPTHFIIPDFTQKNSLWDVALCVPFSLPQQRVFMWFIQENVLRLPASQEQYKNPFCWDSVNGSSLRTNQLGICAQV